MRIFAVHGGFLATISELLQLVASTALLVGCTAAGNFVADHVPRWASGEPVDTPPRPGTPGYEEYRKGLSNPMLSDDSLAKKDQRPAK